MFFNEIDELFFYFVFFTLASIKVDGRRSFIIKIAFLSFQFFQEIKSLMSEEKVNVSVFEHFKFEKTLKRKPKKMKILQNFFLFVDIRWVHLIFNENLRALVTRRLIFKVKREIFVDYLFLQNFILFVKRRKDYFVEKEFLAQFNFEKHFFVSMFML